MHHCGKVQGKSSDKLGRSLSLVGALFPFAFPYRKYCQYHPLYRVKVSGRPCTFRLMESCLRLRSRSQCMLSIAQCILAIVPSRGTSVKTGDIEPSFGRFLAVRFSFRRSPYFDNRQVSIPLFPVRNQVISTKDTAYPGLYPAMFKEGAFRIYIHRLCKFDIVLNPISQGPLVRLQLDKEITAFSPDFIYDGFLEGHGVCRNYAS